MEAKELRIGNLVMDEDAHIGAVVAIHGDVLPSSIIFDNTVWQKFEDGKEYYESVEFLKPIPLTEEWLLKLEFETDKVTYWKKGVNIGHFKSGFFYVPNSLDNRGIDLHFVHRLQNLFFALTNEELTIKPYNI